MANTIPVLRHTDHARQWATSDERTPLFAVVRPAQRPDEAGDDWQPYDETVEYTMPAKPNPGLALDFLRRLRKEGEIAMSWLIELAVGEEGYDALVEDLGTAEDGTEATAILQDIVAKIQKVAMGGLEANPKG